MTSTQRNLVLAVYPNARGFSYVAFESALSPYDWAIVEVRGLRKNDTALEKIETILVRLLPNSVVLQDMSDQGTRRGQRIRDLNDKIEALAYRYHAPVFQYSREHVRNCFSRAAGKYGVAELIANHVPAFQRYLPPRRKAWMSEHVHMGIFDAASLGIAHFIIQGEAEEFSADLSS